MMKTLFATSIGCALATTFAAAELATPDHLVLAGSNRQSALSFYQQLAHEPGNVLFSPYSVSSALAMVYSGARGDTEAEMRKVLHFDLTQERVPDAFRHLNAAMREQIGKGGPMLNIANALCQTRGEMSADYRKLIKESYGAEIFNGDLDGINAWVKKQTEGKIEKIIEELSPDNVCVLLNAVYFKGDWAKKFPPVYTSEKPFHLADGSETKVMMMMAESEYRVHSIPSASMIDIPYKGATMSMVVIVPDAVDGLPALEKQCTSKDLEKWLVALQQAHPKYVSLRMPKFKLEASLDLIPACKALGMSKAFTQNNADFSGMRGKPGELFVGQIKHKVILEVNEYGTEAAATTGLSMMEASDLEIILNFLVDRPFLFLIRENTTGSILFMGRMADPTSKQE